MRGFEDYVQVLGGLGELGLRPPIAPMEGPNFAARERGRILAAAAARTAEAVSGPAFSLIVTDTAPLITLALADSLDALLRLGLPVSIPDAVYIEAIRIHAAPGAERIMEWINAHPEQVRFVPTDIGLDQQRRLEEGRRIRAMGEMAALEVLDRILHANASAEALLLFEDSDLSKRGSGVDERVILISTGDLLRALEGAGLIPSTDRILDDAVAQGRNIEKKRQVVREDIAYLLQ